jgi:chemotaxis protein MotA
MFAIVGIVVVFGAIVAGYLMEKGNLLVLVQPAELIIIGGAALGTLLIANPLHIIKAMLAASPACSSPRLSPRRATSTRSR